MKSSKKVSTFLFWGSIGLVLVLWVALVVREASGVGVYIFLDYAQLLSFLPLLCSRYLPPVYESFKCFLWANLIFDRG